MSCSLLLRSLLFGFGPKRAQHGLFITGTKSVHDTVRKSGQNYQEMTHLYHEVLDVSVENGICVVAAFRQDEEVLASAGRKVTMQLQVEISKIGV